MAGKGFKLTWSPSTSGKSVSEDMSAWTQIVNGSVILNQLSIKAAQNVSFDFTIESSSGNTIYKLEGNNEEAWDTPNILLSRDTYTFSIKNASADTSYTAEFFFYDKKDR